ncbi:MAG: PEP-CTERM sorting domain-containing protein [Phycisphaerae bacterium]
MRFRSNRGTLCALSAAAIAAGASAGSMTVTIGDGYGSGPGGEFNLTPANFPFAPASYNGGNYFESFCLEYNEHISYGQTYHVDVATEARNGGAGGGNPDPLDPLTAYLYSEFVKGSLADYYYDVSEGTGDRAASANALQDVIWYIEQERPISWTPGDNSLRDRLYSLAITNAPDDLGDVRVLNLYRDAGRTEFAQDQLVRIPEPATLGAMMLGGLLLLRRR